MSVPTRFDNGVVTQAMIEVAVMIHNLLDSHPLYSGNEIILMDTTTEEVVSRMNFADDMEIAFSPDEDQAVFISESFITILCRDNGVSFDFWLRKMSRLERSGNTRACF